MDITIDKALVHTLLIYQPSYQQYIEYTDGSAVWRKGVRDTYFVVDVELTETGFEGIENTDWENVKQVK